MYPAEFAGIRVYHRCGGCGKKQEFINSSKISTDLFEAFEANDMETAFEYSRNIDFLKKNNAELK